MAIVIHIPGVLREWTEGKGRVEVEGAASTALEALELLWRRYPGVRDRVVDECNELRAHVNVFVDAESVRFTGGLATALPADAELSIVPAISGG